MMIVQRKKTKVMMMRCRRWPKRRHLKNSTFLSLLLLPQLLSLLLLTAS